MITDKSVRVINERIVDLNAFHLFFNRIMRVQNDKMTNIDHFDIDSKQYISCYLVFNQSLHSLRKMNGLIEVTIFHFFLFFYFFLFSGHHRAASAWRVYKQRRAQLEQSGTYKGDEPFHHFLAVMFPHNQLQILDYNRIIGNFGTIHGDDKDGFLKAISKEWDFEKVAEDKQDEESMKTKEPNDFRMYVHRDGWYYLRPKKEIVEAVKDDVVKRLDVSLLSDHLLTPIMGIKDMRSDPNISFLGGIHGLKRLKEKVDAKGKRVAFGLYHTTIEQLLDIADAEKLMPPKSTWFEPKLRSGVVVRRF